MQCVFFAVGIANIVRYIATKEPWTEYWLPMFLLLFGFDQLHIALHQDRGEARTLEENDERNLALDSKSRDKAFVVLRCLAFVLALIFLLMGASYESDVLNGIGIGNMLAYSITFPVEFLCFLYWGQENVDVIERV